MFGTLHRSPGPNRKGRRGSGCLMNLRNTPRHAMRNSSAALIPGLSDCVRKERLNDIGNRYEDDLSGASKSTLTAMAG
jgi:hypothetical protein